MSATAASTVNEDFLLNFIANLLGAGLWLFHL